MAWSAGTVTVADDASVSGSGAALDLYNNIEAEETAENPLPDPTTPPDDWGESPAAWAAAMTPVVLSIKRRWARLARACATMVTYCTNNALVTVTVPSGAGGAGIQRNPEDGANCLGPSVNKNIIGGIS